MPNKKFPLAVGSHKDFFISWVGPWSQVDVSVDGVQLCAGLNKKDLLKWLHFELEKKDLAVKLNMIWWFLPELYISFDGVVLPWSPADPYHWMKQIFWLVVWLWIINVLFGALAWLWGVEILKDIWLSAISVVYGAVFLTLAFGIKRHSYFALLVIIILVLLDLLFSAYIVLKTEGNISPLLIKIFILMFLVRGFSMMKSIRK